MGYNCDLNIVRLSYFPESSGNIWSDRAGQVVLLHDCERTPEFPAFTGAASVSDQRPGLVADI